MTTSIDLQVISIATTFLLSSGRFPIVISFTPSFNTCVNRRLSTNVALSSVPANWYSNSPFMSAGSSLILKYDTPALFKLLQSFFPILFLRSEVGKAGCSSDPFEGNKNTAQRSFGAEHLRTLRSPKMLLIDITFSLAHLFVSYQQTSLEQEANYTSLNACQSKSVIKHSQKPIMPSICGRSARILKTHHPHPLSWMPQSRHPNRIELELDSVDS